jgi:hypothetical protein
MIHVLGLAAVGLLSYWYQLVRYVAVLSEPDRNDRYACQYCRPYFLQCNGDQDMDRRSTIVTGVDFSSGASKSGVKGATKLYLGKTGIEGKFLKKGTIFYSHRAVGKRCLDLSFATTVTMQISLSRMQLNSDDLSDLRSKIDLHAITNRNSADLCSKMHKAIYFCMMRSSSQLASSVPFLFMTRL